LLPITYKPREMARMSFRKIPKYLTLDEARSLVSPLLKEADYVSWFLCLLLLRTGARISELLSVHLGDVDFNNRTMRIITEKRTSHERFVPVQDDVLAAIGEWITLQAQAGQAITRRDRLFSFGRTTAFLRVREAFHITGIAKAADKGRSNAHPHTLRHSFAVINLAQGVPITVLAEWLGHASIQNTLIYTKIIAQHSRHWAEQVRW